MDFEIMVFMLFMGGLMALAFVGIGVCIGRVDKRIDQRELVGDGVDDAYVDEWTSDRVSDNGCDKQMDAREVINGLQSLRTEISPQEKEYLDYACECVGRIERLRNYIERTKNAEE